MTGHALPSVRLEPMSEAEFRESLHRSVLRHAADYVRRGYWTEARSVEAMEKEFAHLLPNGRETPDHSFAHVVDDASGQRVGETWYQAREQGGKVRFWVDWIAIDPEHRRKGYATATLLRLEEAATRCGADRIGLGVWLDNPGAVALYEKLGYAPTNLWMMKSLGRVRGPNDAGSGRIGSNRPRARRTS